VKTTCYGRLFDGINGKGNVVVSDPISPQITGKAAARHIMRTQGLDPEIPLPSTLRRKGVRDPQGYILQEYMQDSSQIY